MRRAPQSSGAVEEQEHAAQQSGWLTGLARVAERRKNLARSFKAGNDERFLFCRRVAMAESIVADATENGLRSLTVA